MTTTSQENHNRYNRIIHRVRYETDKRGGMYYKGFSLSESGIDGFYYVNDYFLYRNEFIEALVLVDALTSDLDAIHKTKHNISFKSIA